MMIPAMQQHDPLAARIAGRIEAHERALSPFAARAATSRGRERPEPPDPLRSEFQRDRERILLSTSFRRLKHKTQVFIAPAGDHVVTRLTHTLEVAQIARAIARALDLNEDLAEAAALGHDIGHAPFGHAGEQALSEALGAVWRHNEHGLRVVERVENGGTGLNLMWETREAILKSSKAPGDIVAEAWGTASTLEGQTVKLADALAYLDHDTRDAVRVGILSERDLPSIVTGTLGAEHDQRLQTLITDVVATTWAAMQAGPAGGGSPEIGLGDEALQAANCWRDFLFERVYGPEDLLPHVPAAKSVVHFLVAHFRAHPGDVPAGFGASEDAPDERAVDYVAGMTDFFALRTASACGFAPAGELLQRWPLR